MLLKLVVSKPIFGMRKVFTAIGKYFPKLKLLHFFTHNISNQRTDSPESRLEGNGLEVFIPFLSNLLKAFKIQNNLTIRQYYMQKYF